MLKPTETSKKVKVFGKKKCTNFKFLEKFAKSYRFGFLFVAFDLVETKYVRT